MKGNSQTNSKDYRPLDDNAHDASKFRSLSISASHRVNNFPATEDQKDEEMALAAGTYRNRLAFFIIGLGALSVQGFANSVAARALGSGKWTAVVMIALYTPQVTLRTFADYWTNWLSYHVRITLAAALCVTGLMLLYFFMETSQQDDTGGLFHFEHIMVLLSMLLLGCATTVGEMSGYGYCAFFEKQAINFFVAGAGFGSLLGAGVMFLKQAGLQDWHLIVSCFIFPFGLITSYGLLLIHPPRTVHDMNTQTASETGSRRLEVLFDAQQVEQKVKKRRRSTFDKGGVYMTFKLLLTDLLEYSIPLFSVYFIYNIVLSGFIAPSYDVRHNGQPIERYENVFPYFLFILRAGVFLGKSSGFLQIRKFYIFPMTFLIGGVFCGILAYAPEMMSWFNHSDGGFVVLWSLALPLGWCYGSTSASVLSVIRTDCEAELREFALANATTAATVGQIIGNIVAIYVATTVPDRSI